jgi:glycosyltransferase involved in cell wall biosynthesis
MKIYAFIQMYNEALTGNLVRCLNNCKQWADDIIIYDDKSTDNSVEIAKSYTKNIILGEVNEWVKETSHKQKMLEYIHNMDIKPDWILWLDCDEIITNDCIKSLKQFCTENENNNIDAFTFQQINLWRGETYYRTDGVLYGENPNGAGWFVRLWKYHSELSMLQKIGADQRLYPITIKNIKPCPFKIIHYGFSHYKNLMKHIGVNMSTKEDLINTANGEIYVKLVNEGVKWAENYVENGKGVPNMFLNEENLKVKKCPIDWFPPENTPDDIYIEPKPFLISELKTYDEISENILFLGNCQIGEIAKYCSFYLKKKIEYLNIVNDLTNQSPRTEFLIKNADIIVTQVFYKNKYYYNYDKINELKSKNSYILKAHVIYYNGYFPYLEIKDYDNLEKDEKTMNLIQENSNKSLQILYNRENGLDGFNKIDIPIYNFIKNNYTKKRLLLTVNHPTNYVMNYYAYLIYERIIQDVKYFKNQEKTLYNENFNNLPEKLNSEDTYLKIDEFTKKTLNLEF